MEEKDQRLSVKDLRKVKRTFDKNQTSEQDRKINIMEGDTKLRLTLPEAENYVEYNRHKKYTGL